MPGAGLIKAGRFEGGYLSLSVAGGSNVTLTTTEDGQDKNKLIRLTGALTANINIIVPTKEGWEAIFWNDTTGNYTITVKTASGSGVTVRQGSRAYVICDGVDIVHCITDQPAAGGAQRYRLAKTLTGDVTLTNLEATASILEFSGTLGAAATVTIPVVDGAEYIVYNNTGQSVTLKVAAGTGVTILNGKRALVYNNGTDIVRVTPDT